MTGCRIKPGMTMLAYLILGTILLGGCQTPVKPDPPPPDETSGNTEPDDPVAHPVIIEQVPIVEEPVIVTRGDEEGPRQHVWQPLTGWDEEKPGYGMYTYVLFGRKLKPPGRLRAETLRRYESLLRAIHLSTLSARESGIDEEERQVKQATNLFLIPLASEMGEPTPHNYDGTLSLRILALTGRKVRPHASALAAQLSTGEGPFLVSTLSPMEEMSPENFSLLYADLSTTNAAAMAEIVGAYKRRVSEGIGGIERFRSLRIALLDIILDADDNIQIVKSAMAGE